MRVLVVHHEGRYYGGTEILLGHFLAGLRAAGIGAAVAVTRGSRLADAVAAAADIVPLPENERFSPLKFAAQVKDLVQSAREHPCDVVHGWAARDWELAAAAAALLRRPALGTLHDHPRAAYISPQRRTLMRYTASYGLDRLTCPSEAVRAACADAGYSVDKISVVPNGVPMPRAQERSSSADRVRFGFLGVFSEGKGLAGLFEMMDLLEHSRPDRWELHVAGAAQTDAGEKLVSSVRARYESSAWWPRVRWRGWMDDQAAFLREVDVLVSPFTQFEAFGLVVCEAGGAGVPVVATRVGAIPEIVDHGRTGWLFTPGDWRSGAAILVDVIDDAARRRSAGEAARARVAERFSIDAMVRGFARVYSEMA